MDVCVGEFITFENQSEGVLLGHTWKFGSGAIPYNISTDVGPHEIQYFTGGMKEVSLVTGNPLGADTFIVFINVIDDAEADFGWSQVGLGYQFNNESEESDTYLWEFGDGQTSTEEDPFHTYSVPGLYEVRLNAFNDCTDDFDVQNVNVTVTSVEELESEVKIQILPNPNEGVFNLMIEDEASRELNVGLFDLQGKRFENWQIQTEVGKSFFPIHKTNLSQGVYLIKVESEVGVRTLKLVVQ